MPSEHTVVLALGTVPPTWRAKASACRPSSASGTSSASRGPGARGVDRGVTGAEDRPRRSPTRLGGTMRASRVAVTSVLTLTLGATLVSLGSLVPADAAGSLRTAQLRGLPGSGRPVLPQGGQRRVRREAL